MSLQIQEISRFFPAVSRKFPGFPDFQNLKKMKKNISSWSFQKQKPQGYHFGNKTTTLCLMLNTFAISRTPHSCHTEFQVSMTIYDRKACITCERSAALAHTPSCTGMNQEHGRGECGICWIHHMLDHTYDHICCVGIISCRIIYHIQMFLDLGSQTLDLGFVWCMLMEVCCVCIIQTKYHLHFLLHWKAYIHIIIHLKYHLLSAPITQIQSFIDECGLGKASSSILGCRD